MTLACAHYEASYVVFDDPTELLYHARTAEEFALNGTGVYHLHPHQHAEHGVPGVE